MSTGQEQNFGYKIGWHVPAPEFCASCNYKTENNWATPIRKTWIVVGIKVEDSTWGRYCPVSCFINYQICLYSQISGNEISSSNKSSNLLPSFQKKKKKIFKRTSCPSSNLYPLAYALSGAADPPQGQSWVNATEIVWPQNIHYLVHHQRGA